MSWWSDLLERWTNRDRIPARPSTSNGSSSFHAWWEAPRSPVVVASVDLEVLVEPTVNDLYFWALQANFSDERGSRHGGAHIGLQWNRRHPGNRAVNWGGYRDAGNVTSILAGTSSPLPSEPRDPNTRDFPWSTGERYRLRVARGRDGWRGSIIRTDSGVEHVIRELHADGDRLTSLVVWSEVFAPCRAPSAVVRWSSPRCELADGSVFEPSWVRLTFPAAGCPNTDTEVDEYGIVQRSGVTRRAREGDRLPLPTAPPRRV